MEWLNDLHTILLVIQRCISFIGVLIIFLGVLYSLTQYLYFFATGQLSSQDTVKINAIRLNLGRIIILGLEFIVAADLIGTTTTPDYYSVGILGCIVLIRTVLSFSLSREILSISKEG